MKAKRPLILIIRDGWGHNPKRDKNAIALAKTPNTDKLMRECPHTLVHTSGERVGLPGGSQGNSEVGHLNLGAGRIVYQMQVRINRSIEDGSFFRNREILSAIENCRKRNSSLHIMGIAQDEGVHGLADHCIAILRLCRRMGFRDVLCHAFTDGRDSPPKSASRYIGKIENAMKGMGLGRVATVTGRYYAMDRDRRWERVRVAYNALTKGRGERAGSWRQALEDAYRVGETDEFIRPRIIGDFRGMKDGDSVIFYNYRLDRARELTRAFVERGFREFPRRLLDLRYICFTEYYRGVNAGVAFGPVPLKNTFGGYIARKGLRQLRISETEKYAHVTFFFNGQIEEPSRNEDRILVPSPKVPTYDLRPEMSAYEVTDALVKELEKKRHDVIVCNLVNGDMVGHTGNLKAAVRACEAVDDCIGRIVKAALGLGGILLIGADHGNAEEMHGGHRTTHTLNDVPYILVAGDPKLRKCRLRKGGNLGDVAPTMLEILGLPKPGEMTGESLIVHSR